MAAKRTVYGIAVLSLAGIFMMVATLTATTTSWASAVSIGSDAATAANTAAGAPQQFDATLSNALESLQGSGETNQQSIEDFYSAYSTAQADYHTAVSGASAVYNETFPSDPSGASASLISSLNAARDTFVGAITDAKNRLLTELTGGATTPAGGSFNQSYGVAISQYVSNVNGVTTQMEELSQ